MQMELNRQAISLGRFPLERLARRIRLRGMVRGRTCRTTVNWLDAPQPDD